jgi:hypothetical protein
MSESADNPDPPPAEFNNAVDAIVAFLKEKKFNTKFLEPTKEVAVKWLRGCKWREEKVRTKMEAFEALMERIGEPDPARVHEFVKNGALTALPGSVDSEGRQVMIISPEFLDHDLDADPAMRVHAQLMMLEAAAARSETIQRRGFVAILDLTNASNRMNSAAHKVGNEFQESYPARMNKFLVVSPPWWFSFVFAIVSRITSSKFIERVRIVDRKSLSDHIPASSLPERLGGTMAWDVATWATELTGTSQPPQQPQA